MLYGSKLSFILPHSLYRLCPRDVSWQNRSVKNRRQTWNGTLSCPVPFLQIFGSRSFWTAARSCWTRPRSYGKRLKTVKTGLDRQERVIQACQNIRILRHSLSQPVFSMFSHRFSSVFALFTIVQGSVETRSKVCRPSFKGLSKPFKAVFVLFPSKFVYWWPIWSLIGPTPPKDSSTVQFLQL